MLRYEGSFNTVQALGIQNGDREGLNLVNGCYVFFFQIFISISETSLDFVSKASLDYSNLTFVDKGLDFKLSPCHPFLWVP